MGHQIFFFSVTFITLVAFSSGAEVRVTVKVYERSLLACPAVSDQENVGEIKWYRCSPSNNNCEKEWDNFRIAYVENNNTTADKPNFDVFKNGTLAIKMVQPTDDGVMFFCSAVKKYIERDTIPTVLNIVKDPPKLLPVCPRLIHVIKGMDLHMDALVQSYPYPWVTWRHNGSLLQNTSNVASETRLKVSNVSANQNGRYTCYAENLFGHDVFTVDVKVHEESCTPTQMLLRMGKKVTTSPALLTILEESCTPSQEPPCISKKVTTSPALQIQNPSASPPPKTQRPTTSPPPRKEDGEDSDWLTWMFALLPSPVQIVNIGLLIWLVMKTKSIQVRVNRIEIPNPLNSGLNFASNQHALTGGDGQG